MTESELLQGGFEERVKEWTGGGREHIKLALNCVAGKNATALARILSPNGKMVTYGAMSRQPTLLPASLLIFKNITFSGFWVSRWSDDHPTEKMQTVQDVLRMIREGRFRDLPVEQTTWDRDTKVDSLNAAVQGTMDSYRKGKGVFVFGDT